MPKLESLDASDDEDIWDYQPRHAARISQVSKVRKKTNKSIKDLSQPEGVGKRKTVDKQSQPKQKTATDKATNKYLNEPSNSQTSKIKLPSKKPKTFARKRNKTPKCKDKDAAPDGTADADSKADDRSLGYCPVCQMPYRALSIVQSPTWHISECLETPYSSKKECPAGTDCDSTIASHYKKFHHRQLARHRARLKSGESVERSETDTKRKIEFTLGSGKENIPQQTSENTSNTCTDKTDNDEDLPDSSRDVNQMLMDALDDTLTNNDIAYEKSPQSQVIQSNSDISNALTLQSRRNRVDNSKANIDEMDQVNTNNSNSAITISDSDISDNNDTMKIQNKQSQLSDSSDDDNIEATVSSCDPVKISDSSENTKTSKEVSKAPSFFELSQSAQKLGFFAKKRRQRNQASTSESVEEIPLKRARKRIEIVGEQGKGGKTRVQTASIKPEKHYISGDTNNNKTKLISQVEETSCQNEMKHANSDHATEKERQNTEETEKVLDNDCDIKIEEVRSRASDVFFGVTEFTKLADKDDSAALNSENVIQQCPADINENSENLTERCHANNNENSENVIERCHADDMSSDSMSSCSDMFENASEKYDSETESSCAVRESDTDLVGEKQTLEGGFINDDKNCDSDGNSDMETTVLDNNDKANTTLTGSNSGQELEMTVKSDCKNKAGQDGFSSKSVELSKPDTGLARAKTIDGSSCSGQTVESKPLSLMNAFSIMMQKGKSMCSALAKKTSTPVAGKNAFVTLMNSKTKHYLPKDTRPKKGWAAKEPKVTDDTNAEDGTGGEQGGKRSCPFYKKIPGTPFTVDAFRYGNVPDCKAYFLTHFHYDHYGGLTKKFSNPIYCSQITCNLVKSKIKTDDRYLHPIPLNTPVVVEGVQVTFLEANHCPGSVLILFRLKNGKVYFHTGDFRANPKMEVYPALVDLHVHTLYLDTTYCDPQYTFPPQEDVISYAVQLVLDARTANPRTLIVCGSYTIGKERIFTAVAEALNCKISVNRDKKAVLDCLDDPELSARVSLRWQDSGLHVLPMGKLNYQGLTEHLKDQGQGYDSVLALEPTGWTHNKQFKSLSELKPKMKRDRITLYGIPYSEHSSYNEMQRFCQFIRPDKILPTVNNGNVHSRRKMEVIFEDWNNELKQRGLFKK